MDDTVAFSMSGDPRGQGRPRATTRGGYATVYKASKDRAYEDSVAVIAKAAMRGREPLEGPLTASFRFRLSVPKSFTKAARARALAGEEAYFGAFDLSNLVKAIEDGMNGIVYGDDKQIVRCWSEKVASSQPGVDVKITALAPQARPAIFLLSAAAESELPLIVSTPGQGVLAHREAEQAAQP